MQKEKKLSWFFAFISLLLLTGCNQPAGDNTFPTAGQSTTASIVNSDESNISPILKRDPWQMFRHDALHSGFSSSRTAPTIRSLYWRVNVGISMTSSPAVCNGIVYLGAGNVVLALNEFNGKTIWKAQMAGDIYSSPAVDPLAGENGLVYIASYGSRSSTLSAFDAKKGVLVWRTWLSTQSSPVLVYNPPIDSTDIYPPVPRATLYIGSDSNLKAFDADTGKELWNFAAYGVINTTPAVDAGKVYFGTANNIVYALTRYSGRGIWKFEAKGPVNSSPAVGEKLITFGDKAGIVYCLYKETGDLFWYYVTGGSVNSSPAYYNGFIYAGSNDGLLYKFHEGGKLIWSTSAHGPIESSPAIAAGKVYIGSYLTKSSSIICFDDKSGSMKWYDWMQVTSSPSIADTILFVTSLDGYISAYCDLEISLLE